MTKQKMLLFALFMVSAHHLLSEVITLESDVIKIADGTFINADTIEFMRKFRRKILDILLGEPATNGTRIGRYTFDGKKHTVQSLAYIEKELLQANSSNAQSKQKELRQALAEAKNDFVIISEEFIDRARGAKGILVVLIEEDCIKRHHPDSLLIEWAKTPEGQETTMFNQRIINFIRYYSLTSDLLNFLVDLVHSCPKAEKQFKDRVIKWSKVKDMLPGIIKKLRVSSDALDQNKFLKHLKEHHLDELSMQEITSKTIQELLTTFIKPQN